MAGSWSKSEVEAAVEDYFNMLQMELGGHKYNKTEHRRALMERLNNRSHGAVELKHQNVSAALIEMGLPYIEGYKPRFNYQRALLPDVISDCLDKMREIQSLFQVDSEVLPPVPTVEDALALLEKPPASDGSKGLAVVEQKAIYNPIGINYLEKEARNHSLGEAGEQFVINFEKARLIQAGKESLANRIEQVSVTIGPSAGFDIRSFENDGADRFIETKTTKYGKSTPFFITPNDLWFSHANKHHYYLYRVFSFRHSPRIFTLQGHLKDQCLLEPSEYIARLA